MPAIIALPFGFVALLLLLAALLTTSWLKNGPFHEGLWESCDDLGCSAIPYDSDSWLRVVRGFSIMSLILILIGILLCVASFVTRKIRGFMIVGSFLVAALFILIAGTVYAGEFYGIGFGASFVLIWISMGLCLGACVIAYFKGTSGYR